MPERYSLPAEGARTVAPSENRGPEFRSDAETQIVNFVYVQPAQEFRTLERVSNELDSLAEKVGVEAKAYEEEIGAMLSDAGDVLDDIRFTVQSAFGRLVEKSVTKPKKSPEKKPGLLSRFFGKQEPQPTVAHKLEQRQYTQREWAQERINMYSKEFDALVEKNPEFQKQLRAEQDPNKKLQLIREFLIRNGSTVVEPGNINDSTILIGADEEELDARLREAVDRVDIAEIQKIIGGLGKIGSTSTNTEEKWGDTNDLVEL